MENDLEGSVAFITGSASGIGAATARYLVRRGVLLALLDRDETRMRLIASEIAQRAAQKPLIIIANVEQSTEVARAVKQAFDRFGRIDILVNSAGTSTHIPFLELSEDAWDEMVNIHLKGTFLCCRAVAPIMVKQGKGAIVNISSDHAARGAVNLAHYTAAKAGVLALTKSIALELAPYGILVNAVAPGATDTPMFRSHRTEAQIRQEIARIPLRRIAQPEDIAAVISFLVSSESRHITGQTLYVNGGTIMP